MTEKIYVIGLYGKIGSGKDAIAEYLSKKYKFRLLTFSSVLDDILRGEGREVTRVNEIELAIRMRKEHGNDVLAKKLSDRLEDGVYVINGFRYPEEVEFFERYGDDFKLLKADCSRETRYERVKQRGTRGEKSISWDEFLKNDSAKTEILVDSIKADYYINNEGTLSELYSQVDDIIKNELKLCHEDVGIR